MKNTVKKILALVFVVAMVCTLAVPAFAADAVKVSVTVIPHTADGAGTPTTESVEATNVKSALTKFSAYDVSFTGGKINKVNDKKASDVAPYFGDKAEWVVAVNGKIVTADLSTVSVAKNDKLVVFFYNPAFETKMAQFDKSNIAKGIISFFYYDIDGAKQPLTGATVALDGIVDKANNDATTFTTDEKGQIWISPEYLDAASIKISSVSIAAVKSIQSSDKYSAAEKAYHAKHVNDNLITLDVNGKTIDTNNMYLTAGATGDMTIVYVLVAVAAITTLGVVVVMKKKSVKAN